MSLMLYRLREPIETAPHRSEICEGHIFEFIEERSDGYLHFRYHVPGYEYSIIFEKGKLIALSNKRCLELLEPITKAAKDKLTILKLSY